MLAPVGSRVSFAAHIPPEVRNAAGDCWKFTGSGTQALALALCLERDDRKDSRREVLLPAYACPELISAIRYAGLDPVGVDLAQGTPWLDLTMLDAAIGRNTLAVIAVNFLGIPERWSAIEQLAGRAGVAVIEDNAQWCPDAEYRPQGKYMVMSFGRGKPVSLLGGGALCLPGFAAAKADTYLDETVEHAWKNAMQARIYNMMIHPALYGIVARLPGLNLGQTVYKPLHRVEKMGRWRRSLITANMARHRERARTEQTQISRLVSQFKELVTDLADACGHASARLLRYPLLAADRVTRDRLVAALNARGLGASIMYGRDLAGMADVQIRMAGNAPPRGAEYLADRLLTLPVHEFVQESHVADMAEVLGREFSSRATRETIDR